MKLFEEARRQLVGAITKDPAAAPRVVQLGEPILANLRPLIAAVRLYTSCCHATSLQRQCAAA